MKRVEVIVTQAIDTDFVQLYEKECRKAGIKAKYTKLEGVMGAGNTDPKLGDAIWPQLNVMFILYVEDKYVNMIGGIMKKLHEMYVGEGAAAFVSEANMIDIG